MSAERVLAYRHWVIMVAVAFVTIVFFLPFNAQAQTTDAPSPQVEDLGGNQYRVGQIVVNKAAGTFSVPMTLLDQGVPEAPLEFLVVTRNGPKSYEALMELDANAFEFNVACLLIGLNPDNAKMPKGRFELDPAGGDPVTLSVSWEADGQQVTRPVTDFIQVSTGEEPANEWVYLGSYFFPDGRYAADFEGLAVGFVNDVESVIQHSKGIGLISYGATTMRPVDGVNAATPLRLIVSRG